jgi:hypothetical protein
MTSPLAVAICFLSENRISFPDNFIWFGFWFLKPKIQGVAAKTLPAALMGWEAVAHVQSLRA